MNKNMKTIFLFTTLLILLIGVGCISAADITDDSTTDTIKKTTTEPKSIEKNVINKASNSKAITKTAPATEYNITESTYSTYFGKDSVIKTSAVKNDSKIKLAGDFKNKDFVFDNVKLTVTGTGTLYNTSIITQNGAKVVFDGLKIVNTNKNAQAVLFESEGNTLQNSNITVTDNKALHAIEVTGNKNTISNINAKVTAPSADVVYDANYVGYPQTSAIQISSNDNRIANSTVSFDGSQKTGYYPSADGIDIQSPNGTVTIRNNTITNTQVTVKGPVYVYGVNVGRANRTTLENITVKVDSDYYGNGVQLFDANNIVISGVINSTAKNESYGVYSTAMGAGSSKEIYLRELNVTVTGDKSTGTLMEGVSDIGILSSNFVVKGKTATAVNVHVDWMGNKPSNINIRDNTFDIEGTDNNNVLYFGLCDNVEVTQNKIMSTAGSEIFLNKTTNGKVTFNDIGIGNKYIGDNGAKSTENDTEIRQNNGLYLLTDKTYSNFFNNESVFIAKPYTSNTIVAQGDFKNKDFIFDDRVFVNFETKGKSTFYNASFITQNNATLMISGINIDNTNKNAPAVLFESNNNELSNSNIKIVDNKALHGVEITGNRNTLTNITVNVTAPSADVVYDASFVGQPQTSAILIASNRNTISDSKVYFDGSQKTGSYPSADGIDIQSPNGTTTINNNAITNTEVTVKGPVYVYGINVGRAQTTKLTNLTVKVDSDYYSNGVQLFDADGMSITGVINSTAKTEAYGVYSTAMGTGSSKDINITTSNITVNAPLATGALMEGSSNITIADSNIKVTGNSTTAVNAHIDWMGNAPQNVNITNNNMTLNGKANNNVLYFGAANNITIFQNNITSTKGAEINFNKTTKGNVTNNFIKIGSNIFGDNAVKTTEKDTVVKNNTPYITQVKLNKIANVKYGNNVTISGTFVATNGKSLANTKLKINLNGKTVTVKTGKGGAFTYTTKATKVGTNNVTVSYAGNNNYGKVTNKTTFKVVKQNLKITLKKIANVAYKNSVTIKGTFADANGKGIANTNLKLNLNGKTVTVKTGKGGIFTYTTKATKVGTNNVIVSYAGNANYNKVSQKTTFKVVKQSLKLTVSKISTVKYKDTVTITGKLTDANGKVVMNTLVKVKVNSKTYSVKTNNKGVYTLKIKATTIGTNKVTVSYAGNKNYNKASANTTFKVTKQGVIATISSVKVSKGKVTVTGKLTDSNKKVLMNSLAKVTINGKVTNVKTNSKGVYTYTKAVKGTVKVSVSYAGNKNYSAAAGQSITVSA